MQSSIDMIIANDRKARDAVARAEDVRRSAADELAEKKAEISKNIEKEAQAAARRYWKKHYLREKSR